MGYKEMYEEWLNNPYFDDATKAELKAIEGMRKRDRRPFLYGS